jgi:hypothetical protein
MKPVSIPTSYALYCASWLILLTSLSTRCALFTVLDLLNIPLSLYCLLLHVWSNIFNDVPIDL